MDHFVGVSYRIQSLWAGPPFQARAQDHHAVGEYISAPPQSFPDRLRFLRVPACFAFGGNHPITLFRFSTAKTLPSRPREAPVQPIR